MHLLTGYRQGFVKRTVYVYFVIALFKNGLLGIHNNKRVIFSGPATKRGVKGLTLRKSIFTRGHKALVSALSGPATKNTSFCGSL